MPKDPICGMDVKPEEAFAEREYSGQVFYFCSQACVDKFDNKFPQATQSHRDLSHQNQINRRRGKYV
jgi:YHS domain-containing protein